MQTWTNDGKFREESCVSCGKAVLATGPRRHSRSDRPFHVDCPCPDRRRDGVCRSCDTIYGLTPVVDLLGEECWVLPRHWRPTKSQAAISTAFQGFGLSRLFHEGSRILSTPRGGVPCHEYDILWQQDECPGSHEFAPEQWESFFTRGSFFTVGSVDVLEPWGWSRKQLERIRRERSRSSYEPMLDAVSGFVMKVGLYVVVTALLLIVFPVFMFATFFFVVFALLNEVLRKALA